MSKNNVSVRGLRGCGCKPVFDQHGNPVPCTKCPRDTPAWASGYADFYNGLDQCPYNWADYLASFGITSEHVIKLAAEWQAGFACASKEIG